MKRFNLILAAFVLMFANGARAQLTFSGPPAFVTATSSGTLTPTASYVIAPLAGGMSLTGDFYVTVPAGPSTGSLIYWEVDRPISAGTAPFNITTNYTGFISLSGAFTTNSSFGSMNSDIVNGGNVVPLTQSKVSFTYSGANTPMSMTNTVTVPSYTYTPGDYLRLSYTAFLNYNGSGGVYDLNFPAETIVTPTPEPGSALLIVAAMSALGMRRRRKAKIGFAE